ncbi:Transcriptional regulatory protein CusR (plasmid) [Pseudosulfitobacter sp. DSM 107133]|nr:Transcriptional regulatory protein CusR [Pseudosulfitobacter sp. DSM 107133]
MPSLNVILVEDNTALRESLMDCFAESGIRAVAAETALQFYRLLASSPCDIAILDIGLPDEDGLSILQFLRQEKPHIGAILMTARGSLNDRIAGLQTGADIFLTKPVEYVELEAALRNLSRRLGAQATSENIQATDDDWVFHKNSFRLIAPNNVAVPLTHQECRLVNGFAQAEGATVPRHEVLAALGYAQTDAGQRSLNATLVRLRAKVDKLTGLALPVQTIRGLGYVVRNLQSE